MGNMQHEIIGRISTEKNEARGRGKPVRKPLRPATTNNEAGVNQHSSHARPVTHGFADLSTELAARRTGMSFQRTRLSADGTLMSVIRTSLSLISFGFTIFQFFQRMLKDGTLEAGASHAARNFGRTLVWLGVGMLVIGIVYHVQFMAELRNERRRMKRDGAIFGESRFPASFTLIAAILLLLIGLAAIASVTFHLGPFV
jgi:putative membrane protein